jgi:N utilization substance protein B
VLGVSQHQAEIDDQLETYAQGWSLNRMPALDRAILRLATWEILFNDEIPDGVAIDEAVELAKEYSTDNSASFVNGLLGKIVSTRTAL